MSKTRAEQGRFGIKRKNLTMPRFTAVVLLLLLCGFCDERVSAFSIVGGTPRQQQPATTPTFFLTKVSSESNHHHPDRFLSRRRRRNSSVHPLYVSRLIDEDQMHQDHQRSDEEAEERTRKENELLLLQETKLQKLEVAAYADDIIADVDDVDAVEATATAIANDSRINATETILRLWNGLNEKIGTVDESRIMFPEYNQGEIPRMFSSLEYAPTKQQHQTGDDDENDQSTATNSRITATHAAGSVLGAAALVAGTTVGAGVLALPTATAAAGFLPSTGAMLIAYIYMTMSGLLIAELTLNRIGRTGRPGVGLLDLFDSNLGQPWTSIGSGAYFFLHYAIMVAYIAQGGVNVGNILSQNSDSIIVGSSSATAAGDAVSSSAAAAATFLSSLPDGAAQVAFAGVVAASLFVAKPSWVEKVNNVMVAGVAASFLGIVAIGAGSADFGALIDPINQHPELVVDCFPILFLSLVFQNVVPTVVNNLEGDRTKIIQAIVAGTTAPLIMFLAWNAVCLGNVMGTPGIDMASIDPVMLLQSGQAGGAAPLLAPLVTTFSVLALVTSMIGFTYGLLDAWTDILKLPTRGDDYEKWKPALFALVFMPPLALSMTSPDIFYNALDIAGAFGVSTLFIVLPPIMVWKERYQDVDTPLMTRPMVPLGKIPLGSMWKAAATLIVEQGAEKLGVFEWFQAHVLNGGIL